jgi:Zn-dependent peptidase ImmA (M78 family)
MKLNLPKLSYLKIGERAEIFLAKYHSSLSLPIPVEEIAELKLGLSLVPIKTLKKDFDVDGFLDSTLTKIFIDFDLYTQQENRTRFTIAHEIGHLVLHQEIFQKINIKNEKDLHNLIENIDNDEYSWMEYQAYSFAGHLLVPKIN